MHYEPGGLAFKDPKKRKKEPHHVLVKNKSNVPRKLAMGQKMVPMSDIPVLNSFFRYLSYR